MATTQPGETKVFLMENASTSIYTYVDKEICSETVDGIETDFTVTTAPVSVTGIDTAALSQYYDTTNSIYGRRDVLIFYRKDGADNVIDTSDNVVTITTTTLAFATAPLASEADSIVVSYCHTTSNRTDEVISVTPAGGNRPVEYVTVQGGEKVRIEKPQEEKTISMDVLSVDNGFVPYVNGNEVSQVSGSDTYKYTVGAQERDSRKAIVVTVEDPTTGNKRIECFFNVVGVSNEGSAPSDGYWSESVSFSSPPQDYCRIVKLNDQS